MVVYHFISGRRDLIKFYRLKSTPLFLSLPIDYHFSETIILIPILSHPRQTLTSLTKDRSCHSLRQSYFSRSSLEADTEHCVCYLKYSIKKIINISFISLACSDILYPIQHKHNLFKYHWWFKRLSRLDKSSYKINLLLPFYIVVYTFYFIKLRQ